MKVKRIFTLLILCLFSATIFVACSSHSSESLTFNVETGDQIKVSLDTTNGYKLSQNDGTITVEKDGETILQGVFVTPEQFSEYDSSINSTFGVDILEHKSEAPLFYLYQVEGESGTETDFLAQIDGAQAGVIFGSLSSLEDAKAAYNALTFEKVG